MAKEIKHSKYSEFISFLKNYEKPVLIIGNVGCGKSTAIKQASNELKLDLYYLGSIENSKDFFGIDNLNTQDVPSNLMLAYLKGGILYVDDLAKRKASMILELLKLVKKDSLTIGKKKYMKHKDFRVVLSCENENELILKYVNDTIVKKKLVNATEFGYDEKIEKSICKDKEFYSFFLEVRKFTSGSIYTGATTSALSKCCKLIDTGVFTPIDIIEALLVKGYNKNYLKELYLACSHLELDNKYVLALKNLITLKN